MPWITSLHKTGISPRMDCRWCYQSKSIRDRPRQLPVRRAQVDDCIDMPRAMPGSLIQESLWAVVSDQVQPGWRVLVVRGMGYNGGAEQGQGRDWFADRVRGAGGRGVRGGLPARLAAVEAATQLHAERASADGSDVVVQQFRGHCQFDPVVSAVPVVSGQGRGHASTHCTGRARGQFWQVCESRPTLAELMASIESL